MKNLITSIVTFLCVLSAQAQYVKNEPGNFTGIQISGKMSVVLIPSNKTLVEVNGMSAESVQIMNKSGKLSIQLPSKEGQQLDGAQVTVFFKSLENMQVDGGAKVVCTSPLETHTLTLNIKDASDVYLYTKTINANAELVKNSVLKLIGNSDNFTINMKENCELKARDLINKKATISLDADGNAQISASEAINAKVSTQGSIFVYGEPKAVTKKADAGGNITIVL
jgi:hypothetical protein